MLEAQQRHAEKLPWTHTDSGVTDSLTNLCKQMLVILAVFTQQDLRVFLSSLVWLHAPFMSKHCIYGRFECVPLSVPRFLTSYEKLTWKGAPMCFSQVCRVSAQGMRTIGTATMYLYKKENSSGFWNDTTVKLNSQHKFDVFFVAPGSKH